jgi:hypothetical protein
LISVSRMEMWGIVVTVIHEYDESVKPRDLWHV